MLGIYPSPVQRLDKLSQPGCEVWVKRDDLTHGLYGGNKVRKLELLLAQARTQGARRLVTIGAVGSHHVLATAVHGTRAGFDVAAILSPQPFSPDIIPNLRAGLAAGLHPIPCPHTARVPLAVVTNLRRGDYFIAPGGSNVQGALGYAAAAVELGEQVRRRDLPEPEIIVVALGSGGTAAGLVAGLTLWGSRTRVVAVRVVPWPLVSRSSTVALAHAALRYIGGTATLMDLSRRLEIDNLQLGNGYGHATVEGALAIQEAASLGLHLDATYTGKAFACALRRIAGKKYGTVLFWNTLSSAPMAPLLVNAPEEHAIEPSLRKLWGGSTSRAAAASRAA